MVKKVDSTRAVMCPVPGHVTGTVKRHGTRKARGVEYQPIDATLSDSLLRLSSGVVPRSASRRGGHLFASEADVPAGSLFFLADY